MEFIDITSLTNEELNELLASANTEKQRREAEKLFEAEKAFYEAARALYAIDPDYDFPVTGDDLNNYWEENVSLYLLLRQTGNLPEKIQKTIDKVKEK